MVRVRPSTVSPPGTRSRRQNETRQHQVKSRLTNGFSSAGTTNHVKKLKSDRIRTRSKVAKTPAAKKSPTASPNSARRKRRELQLRNNSIIINNHSTNHATSATGAELKRLHINMRFIKNEKIHHSSPVKTSTPNHKGKSCVPTSAKNGNISAIKEQRNGLRKSNKNNISPTKNENKLNYRHQVLKSYKKKREKLTRLSGHHRLSKSSEESDDDDGDDSENRDRKRRSALWVLNCEAEEFLFGETAAEKHEVVLPPKSAEPPEKRRRMRAIRATELGDLLKETPLLESKLRKPLSSGSEVSPNSNSPVGGKGFKTSSRKKSVKRKIFESDDTSDSLHHTTEDDEYIEDLMVSTSPYQTTASFTSSSSCIGSPRVTTVDYHSQADRLHNLLENLEFRFSFQTTPTNEIWYRTFSRQESPKKTFQPTESPIVLPYERNTLSKRALARLSRLPRKSPRCHASTLAILSSLKPGRSSRLNSLSMPLSVNCSYDTPISTRSLNHPQRLLSGPNSLSPRPCSSSSLQPNSPTPSISRRRRCVSIQSPPVLQTSMASKSSCELKATEYVSDALAFLDDPYVVGLLAEEPSPRSPIKIRSVKKATPATRSTQKPAKSAKLDKNANNRKKKAAPPTKQTVPPPKTSPKLAQNGSHNSKLNCVNSEHHLQLRNSSSRSPPSSPKHSSSRGSSGPSSPKHFPSRGSSGPSSPKHPPSRGSSGPSSPQSRPNSPTLNTRKSVKKSPIVLVSDIYKRSVKSCPAKHGALNCFGEEVLFQSVDWLPPLPSLY